MIRALPGLHQRNLPFIALAVPIHLLLALLAWRQHAVAAVARQRNVSLV
jgi:hypothetical protein